MLCNLSSLNLRANPIAWLAAAMLLAPPSLNAADDAMSLRLETEFGELGAAPTDKDPSAWLPVLLGITHINHRIRAAERETQTWQTANQALADHLVVRERHLADLQSFVARQDGAIELLESQAEKLEKLTAAVPTASSTTSAQRSIEVAPPPASAPSGSRLFGVALDSQYLAGGLLAVIAVLLAWALGLRSRLSRRDSLSAGESLTPVKVTAPAVAAPQVVAAEPSHEEADSVEFPAALLGEDESAPQAETVKFMAQAVEPDESTEPAQTLDVPAVAAVDEPYRAEQASLSEGPAASDVSIESEAGATKTDGEALKEIDTLIAFENYEQAADKLNGLLDKAPDNPEYRLRLLHILSAGGEEEASKEQEEILEAMMDGPLSETLARVRRIGQDLLPGHPLFHAAGAAAAHEAEVRFESDSVFDVTEASEDGSSTPPAVAEPDAPALAPEVDDDDDLDDFIRTAFDENASELHAENAPDENSLDFTLDFQEAIESQEDDVELSFDTDDVSSLSDLGPADASVDPGSPAQDLGATVFNLRERVAPPR